MLSELMAEGLVPLTYVNGNGETVAYPGNPNGSALKLDPLLMLVPIETKRWKMPSSSRSLAAVTERATGAVGFGESEQAVSDNAIPDSTASRVRAEKVERERCVMREPSGVGGTARVDRAPSHSGSAQRRSIRRMT